MANRADDQFNRYPPLPSDVPRKKTTDNKRRLKLLLSYAPDWVITIGATGLFYLLDSVEGFRRHFSIYDSSIQYPHTLHERVPMWLLLVLVVATPLVIMPVVNVATVRSWWDWHNSWLGLVLSFGLTGTITNIIKITSGRPRPDMLARCLPRPGSENAAVFGLIDSSICTRQNTKMMRDAFRSFVSGHSSLAFAGLGFLTWYMAGKMHLFDKRGHALKSWIAVTPLVGAILIAITRTMDYRHHWQDVFIGGLLGLALSYFCYRQYYPSLKHPLCHRPYSPRIKRAESSQEMPLRDRSPAGATAVGDADPKARTHTPVDAEQEDDDNTLERRDPDLTDLWNHGTDHNNAERRGPMAV